MNEYTFRKYLISWNTHFHLEHPSNMLLYNEHWFNLYTILRHWLWRNVCIFHIILIKSINNIPPETRNEQMECFVCDDCPEPFNSDKSLLVTCMDSVLFPTIVSPTTPADNTSTTVEHQNVTTTVLYNSTIAQPPITTPTTPATLTANTTQQEYSTVGNPIEVQPLGPNSDNVTVSTKSIALPPLDSSTIQTLFVQQPIAGEHISARHQRDISLPILKANSSHHCFVIKHKDGKYEIILDMLEHSNSYKQFAPLSDHRKRQGTSWLCSSCWQNGWNVSYCPRGFDEHCGMQNLWQGRLQ